MHRALLLLIIAGTCLRPAAAQVSNADILSALAVECVSDAVGTADSVALGGPERLPFIRSAIVAAWQSHGHSVFVPGSAGAGAAVRLTVEHAAVSYDRSKDQVARTVDLRLRMERHEADGRVSLDEACLRAHQDTVPKNGLSALEDPVYPETQGAPPPPGWFRRYLQPAMIVAASAVGTFLFFSLRSSRTDDG